MNKHIAIGRLTRDPELRATQSGRQVATFRLAVDRRTKKDGEQSADFFDYVAFDERAKFVAAYLHKGSKILVESRPQNNNYTKQDGTKVYGYEDYVENIEFVESRREAEGSTENAEIGAGEMTEYINDGELPF